MKINGKSVVTPQHKELKLEDLTSVSGRTYDYGDLMTLEDFRTAVEAGAYNDYDGFGLAVISNKIVDRWGDEDVDIYPSRLDHALRLGATHILWFNK